MTIGRPDYIQRRIDLAKQRREADRTHSRPCDCPFHAGPGRLAQVLAANQARLRRGESEAPF